MGFFVWGFFWGVSFCLFFVGFFSPVSNKHKRHITIFDANYTLLIIVQMHFNCLLTLGFVKYITAFMSIHIYAVILRFDVKINWISCVYFGFVFLICYFFRCSPFSFVGQH